MPDTPTRARYELGLHLTLGSSLLSLQGPSAPEVKPVRTRARELCEQVGDTAQLSEVLLGLFGFHGVRGELQTALELAEQHLRLAQREHDAFLRFLPHYEIGFCLFFRGELAQARTHFEQAIVLYDPQQHRDRLLMSGHDTAW